MPKLYEIKQKDIVKLKCHFCGKEFYRKWKLIRASEYDGFTNHYCSQKCTTSKHNSLLLKLLSSAKVYNKKKGFDKCDLDEEYMVDLLKKQEGKCVYSGVDLVTTLRRKKTDPPIDHRFALSLDRIDSNLGYVKGNVQFISISMNYMKNTLSHEQTLELIKIIKNNN